MLLLTKSSPPTMKRIKTIESGQTWWWRGKAEVHLLVSYWRSPSVPGYSLDTGPPFCIYTQHGFWLFFFFITLHYLLQFLSYSYPSLFLNPPFYFLLRFISYRARHFHVFGSRCMQKDAFTLHTFYELLFYFLFIRCIRWTIFTYNGTPFWPLANRVLWKVFSIHYFSPSDLCVSEWCRSEWDNLDRAMDERYGWIIPAHSMPMVFVWCILKVLQSCFFWCQGLTLAYIRAHYRPSIYHPLRLSTKSTW